jgi:hypothetical protein
MKKEGYKPLLFTTTVRNPKRIKGLLYILLKYNGKTLTNDLCCQIVCELMRYGLYRPQKQSSTIRDKWKSTQKGTFSDIILSNEEIEYLFDNNPQSHKEAGFEKGYPSRFATIFNFAKELGFVYFNINGKIEFSKTGILLANIYKITIESNIIIVEEEHPEYEQMAFLQAMVKYQRKNPFIRVLNDNVPLILLLQVIQKLNNDKDYNNCGISTKEIPLLIFWKNNDADSLYKRIKKLRKDYKYNPSNEIIENICINEIMGGFKKFKSKSIVSEYPDEFIRKMRITGLITLRGAGRFIDINHNEDKKIDYILKNYSSYNTYSNERDYFDYMSKIDNNLFKIQSTTISSNKSEELLNNWLEIYQWEKIKKELEVLSKKSSSKDEVLKFIPEPARLEFLSSLAIKSKIKNIRVIPNYPCDDEGLPTSTAGGNKGDIICYENMNGILVEVTLAEGRVQTIMEVWPIERHLEQLKKEKENSIGYFIAPSIFSDSRRQIEFIKQDKNHYIKALTINEFINYLETNNYLYTE